MKPNWVLSDEQCNIRFRRVRQEKELAKEEIKTEVEDIEEIPRFDDVVNIKTEQPSPTSTGSYFIVLYYKLRYSK